ncbi:MAG: MFS transporter [Proteobacteria bacterium]|nr:MFS transporter [Pseudomonadota bacterium]
MSSQAHEPGTRPSRPADVGFYSWYVLALLTLGYLSNHIDRNILMILLEDIKTEFGVSDLMMGLLTGPAFALFYTIAGIPIARWADRGSRRLIVSVSTAVWSAFTALSGAARSFLALAACRVGVGIGEAGGSPPSHSLISDYFPAALRAKALGVYAAGTQAGSAFGWLTGGLLSGIIGWRGTFVVVGLPGIALALLMRLTIREPRRGAMETARTAVETLPFREALGFLIRNRTYLWLQFGGALHAVSAYGLGVWVAPFLIRIHGLELPTIGMWLGFNSLFAGTFGMFLGGWVADRLTPRDPRWYLGVPAVSAVLTTPFTLLFLFLGDPTWALICFVGHTIVGMGYSAPVYAVTQATVKVRARSLAVAVHLFIVNLIGLGLGPVIIGGLNDALHAGYGVGAIRYTMALAALTNLTACLFYWLASRSVRADLAAMAEDAEA